jgi:hypothetical protein
MCLGWGHPLDHKIFTIAPKKDSNTTKDGIDKNIMTHTNTNSTNPYDWFCEDTNPKSTRSDKPSSSMPLFGKVPPQ